MQDPGGVRRIETADHVEHRIDGGGRSERPLGLTLSLSVPPGRSSIVMMGRPAISSLPKM